MTAEKKDFSRDQPKVTSPELNLPSSLITLHNSAKRFGRVVRSKSRAMAQAREYSILGADNRKKTVVEVGGMGIEVPQVGASLEAQHEFDKVIVNGHDSSPAIPATVIKPLSGVRLIDIKRNKSATAGHKFTTTELAKPTVKELEAYREIEKFKMEIKALKKVESEDKVKFPPRGDSGAWREGLGKLLPLSEYVVKPSLGEQLKVLGRLNEAGIYLMGGTEENDLELLDENLF